MDPQIENLEKLLRDPLGNAESLAQFVSGSEEQGAASDADTTSEQPQAAKDEDEPAEQAAAQPEPEPAKEPIEPVTESKQVIKSKDGKHEIPYAVLQAERERNRRLEAQIAELSAKQAAVALEAAGGPKDESPPVHEIVDEATIEQLREDAPVLAKVIDSLTGRISALQEEVASARKVAQSVEAERQADKQTAVEEAIDAVPKLLHVKHNDVAAYNQIADIDVFLRSQPTYQGLSLTERFEKAVSMYEAVAGPIQLPNRAGQEDTVDAKAKADAAIERANQQARPQTLSDLPGGSPPPKNDLDVVQNMSAVALTNKLINMTPQQAEAFLARLA